MDVVVTDHGCRSYRPWLLLCTMSALIRDRVYGYKTRYCYLKNKINEMSASITQIGTNPQDPAST